MIKKGILFGSFDPIHNGHIEIANYFLKKNLFDEVILMVTPTNPFKSKKNKNSFSQRYKLVELGVKGFSKIRASNIENSLPKPNFTCHTLEFLRKKNPGTEYVFLMGSDLLNNFTKWKNYIEIINNHKVFVYPRNDKIIPSELKLHENIKFFKASIIQISSTIIRDKIKNNVSIKGLVPIAVNDFLIKNKSYED